MKSAPTAVANPTRTNPNGSPQRRAVLLFLYTLLMLSAAARARLTVVLAGARNPLNIGAAARALHDFGFSDLRIANDFAAPLEAAQVDAAQADIASAANSAIAAHAVLHAARRFDTLTEAIADCTLIVGTTAIGTRELTLPVLTLQQSAPQILTALNHPQPRVALLFGSEKTGLTNDQLSHCHLLTTIPLFSPSEGRHLSMNLGQSVAVCLYELTRDGLENSAELPELHQSPPTAQDRELLTQLLLDVLHTTGYTRRFPANATEPLIRQLVLKLGSTHRECMTWMGILKQILWHQDHPPNIP